MASSSGTEGSATPAPAAGSPTDAAARAAETATTAGQKTGAAPSAGELSGPLAAQERALTAVRFSCQLNAGYHACREAFLDTAHRWLMFGVIVAGAGAITDLFPDWPFVRPTLAMLTAVFGALDLTFDLSNRARAHGLMKRRYHELLAELSEKQCHPDDVRGIMARYAADEEPVYEALFHSCWNAARKSVYGTEADLFEIGFWTRRGKNVFRLTGYDFGEPKTAAQRAEHPGRRWWSR